MGDRRASQLTDSGSRIGHGSALPDAIPSVSVVVPTYNRAALLGRAVKSVLAQTFKDYELIVVDDGSTDDTQEVLREFTDQRIRTLRSDVNQGAPRARNRGIQAARGEWVAFLDSDDEWLPKRLELQMERLAHQGPSEAAVGYCLFQAHECRTGKVVQPVHTLAQDDVLKHLLGGRWPKTTSAFMVRRGALLDVGGFDESMPCGEDIDLWLRLAQKGYRYSACNEVLVLWHLHPQARLSQDPSAAVQGFELFAQRWGGVMWQSIGYGGYCRWRLRRTRHILGLFWDSVRGEMRQGNFGAALRCVPTMLLFWSRWISAGLCVICSGWRSRRQ